MSKEDNRNNEDHTIMEVYNTTPNLEQGQFKPKLSDCPESISSVSPIKSLIKCESKKAGMEDEGSQVAFNEIQEISNEMSETFHTQLMSVDSNKR